MEIHSCKLRYSSIFSFRSMDDHDKKLIQIKNYIQKASVCNEKGLARLYYIMAIELLSELSIELNNRMLALESAGEQPKEVFHD